LLFSTTSVCCVRTASAIPSASTIEDLCSRVPSRSGVYSRPQGVSLLPFCFFYSNHNTASSPCSSERSLSAPFSRLPPAAPGLSSLCKQFSSELETEVKVILTTHYWRD
jgi:hypothetical protein